MSTRDSETIRDLLAMSTAMLAMQRDITELRLQVEQMRAAKPNYLGTLTTIFGLLLRTRTGQAILGSALTAGAGAIKHYVGRGWCGWLPITGLC